MATDTRPRNHTRTGNRARLTSQGQITVPKRIREALGIKPGDEIEFVPRGSELVVEVRPRRSVLEFAGVAGSGAPHVPGSRQDLDDLIEAAMRDAAVARQRRVSSKARATAGSDRRSSGDAGRPRRTR
jgi:AbrB family looped-hinge helix DNA binding protein